jgi:hypothetical protein
MEVVERECKDEQKRKCREATATQRARWHTVGVRRGVTGRVERKP